MIKRILVGIDGSKDSFVAEDYGIFLSKKLNKPVIGIHIVDTKLINEAFIEDLFGTLGCPQYVNITEKMKEYLDEKGRVLLKSFAIKCREAGGDCSIAQAFGRVPDEIINMSDIDDLIILGKKGVHEDILPDFHIGSTVDKITKRSKCPVLIVQEEFKGIKNILVAFNGNEKSIKALRYSESLAKSLGVSKLHIVSVIEDRDDKESLENIKKNLGDILKLDYELHTLYGYPEEKLKEFLEEHKEVIDIISIGAFGKNFIKEFLLGSTTYYIVHKSPVPVLVVK